MYLTNILHIAPNKVSNIIGLKFKDLTVKSLVATALSLFVVAVTYKLLCPYSNTNNRMVNGRFFHIKDVSILPKKLIRYLNG